MIADEDPGLGLWLFDQGTLLYGIVWLLKGEYRSLIKLVTNSIKKFTLKITCLLNAQSLNDFIYTQVIG